MDKFSKILREAIEEVVNNNQNNNFQEGDICRLNVDLSRIKEGFGRGTAVRVTGIWGNMVDIEELGGNQINEVDIQYLRKIR